jgi:CHAD domain-containing protein
MAFRIKSGEAARQAVKRMARAELKDVKTMMADRRTSLTTEVHDVRTAIKKVRALVRLVRPAVGRPARKENRRLRKIARVVSGVRDADVILKTFDSLTPQLPAAARPRIAPARRALASKLKNARQPFQRSDAEEDIGRALGRAAKRVSRWAPDVKIWRAVGPGFVDGYRRARRTMEAAYRAGDGAAFHAWRRAVKTHRHQVHVLEAICPRVMKPRLDLLEQLAECLGDEHDLTVLGETLATQRQCFSDREDHSRALRLVEKRQARLRAQARPLGKSLFRDKPYVFGRHARAEVRAFRRHEKAAA